MCIGLIKNLIFCTEKETETYLVYIFAINWTGIAHIFLYYILFVYLNIMVTLVQYLCNQCKVSQTIKFTEEMREMYVTRDPNGLSLYSHIHLCENGMAGVNNLNLDHNIHVRGYNFIEIPRYKKKKKTMMVPGAPKAKKEKQDVRVTQIFEKDDLNILIQFDMSEITIQIGQYNHTNNVPAETITSNTGTVSIHYYKSKVKFTKQLEKWLRIVIDSWEMLIPSKLGLVVEVLQFIITDKDKYPSEMDENIIKSILVSHDIFFEFRQSSDFSTLSHAYGEENGTLMKNCMDWIQENPMTNLHEMVLKFKKPVVEVMFALLILEVHGIIVINRPGIMSSDVDLDSLLSM